LGFAAVLMSTPGMILEACWHVISDDMGASLLERLPLCAGAM
jgi:hypothetical protein